jgi:nitrate reductase NapE component
MNLWEDVKIEELREKAIKDINRQKLDEFKSISNTYTNCNNPTINKTISINISAFNSTYIQNEQGKFIKPMSDIKALIIIVAGLWAIFTIGFGGIGGFIACLKSFAQLSVLAGW